MCAFALPLSLSRKRTRDDYVDNDNSATTRRRGFQSAPFHPTGRIGTWLEGPPWPLFSALKAMWGGVASGGPSGA